MTAGHVDPEGNTPRNAGIRRLATDGHIAGNDGLSKECDTSEVGSTMPTSSVSTANNRVPTPTISEPESADGKTMRESDFDDDIGSLPSLLQGNPDPYWIQEWAAMDLRSAIAAQVEFFGTRPTFNNSNIIYALFFIAIRNTVRDAAAAKKTIATDVTARGNLKSLHMSFQDFTDRSRFLLKEDLERIKAEAHSRCNSSKEFLNMVGQYSNFLELTQEMAFFLGLGGLWAATSTSLRAAMKCFTLDQQQDVFGSGPPSVQDIQPAESPLHTKGPLSSEMLEMDYEFTNTMWFQWIESCIAYFAYWTAEPTGDIPAHDFIRHLSHYRLAMELFLRHSSVSDEKLSTLVKLAKKYACRYREYAAMLLEKMYAELKEDVEKTNIYNTEARFWRIADDIEVLMNQSPQDIKIADWNDMVPSILPQDKVLVAKNAVNVLYNEFQTKRYPEDEVAYLWLLTWRNIKHNLACVISSAVLDVNRPKAEGLTTTIEPCDLALPFVEKNFSQLLTITKKDNDALYQREIESLVGDYCAHIHRYAIGQGEGQERIYEQFASLSHTKRVPFIYLVNLEESLLQKGTIPNNGSQMIAHRVVKRLNHIMEGPKEFKRWEQTETGRIKTYSPTSTWVAEQEALKHAAGFNLDDVEKPPSTPSSSLSSRFQPQSFAAGGGAGGDDDSDDDRPRRRLSGENEESSDSNEEVEEVSPGGTKRTKKQKKGKRPTPPEILTKAKLEQLMELSKRPNCDPTRAGLSSEAESEAEEEKELDGIMSGLHSLPPNSLDYHRRRLNLLKVDETSAFPNAQYPLPETAAPQRAAALQIARELADPGIFTHGPRPEDVQNYINPALRLPLTEANAVTGQQGQEAAPHLVRRALVRLRTTLGGLFFGSSPRASPSRATPRVPESNAQRTRRELAAREAKPPALKRQADKFSVTKSPPRNGSSRQSRHRFTSISGSHQRSSRTDVDLPWSGKNQDNHSMSSGKSRYRTGHTTQGDQAPSRSSPGNNTNQENQAPSGSSPSKNSNQENESPGRGSNQENQGPPNFIQRAELANGWNSPSPPHEYDNRIYPGSPIRSHSSPTPVKGHNATSSSRSQLPDIPPSPAQAGPSGQHGDNVNASPLLPPSEQGPSSQLKRLNRWVRMEMASNNQDMRAAYLLHRGLVREQTPNTLAYLFEILRGHVEMATFNNYVFERETGFGPEVRPQIARGVPNTIRTPGTPRAQILRRSQQWWNDPLEGTREGFRRTGVAWAEPPPEDGEVMQNGQSRLDSRLGGSGSTSTMMTPETPSPTRDENGNPIPWEVVRATDPQYGLEVAPTSPRFSERDPNRTWSWHSHPSTGLPLREFNIYINPDTRSSTHPSGWGEPLLVEDPLSPGQLTTNPRFSPEILELISAAGRDDHGQIHVRVPSGWRVNVGPPARSVRSGALSPRAEWSNPYSTFEFGPTGEQQVSFTSPGFAIYEDASSGAGSGNGGRRSVQERTNAPPTLGLVDLPQQEQHHDHNAMETVAGKSTNQKSQATSTSHSQKSGSERKSGSRSKNGNGSKSGSRNRSGSGTRSERASSSSNSYSTSTSTSKPPPSSQRPSPPPPPPPPAKTTTTTPPLPSPWYLTWSTSTVIRLREELRRRATPLSKLTLKQQMIDRLRKDDAENGVGGVYHPTEEEEEEEDEEEILQGEEEGGDEVLKEKQELEREEEQENQNPPTPPPAATTVPSPALPPLSPRPALKRRHNPFLLDWKSLSGDVSAAALAATERQSECERERQKKRKRCKR